MAAPDEIAHLINILIVTIWLKNTFCKILCVVLIIHRIGIQYLALLGVLLRGEHGQNGGIQPTRKEGAQRHIRYQLTRGGVRNQVVRPLDSGGLVVGMLMGVKRPIGAVGEAVGREHRKMPGAQLVNVLEHAAAGRARGP